MEDSQTYLDDQGVTGTERARMAGPWSKTQLLHAIARHWGGEGTVGTITRKRFMTFTAACDATRYVIWFPGALADLAEDDGRPFKMRVPAGELLVRGLDDAPDCWWYVHVERSLAEGRIVRSGE